MKKRRKSFGWTREDGVAYLLIVCEQLEGGGENGGDNIAEPRGEIATDLAGGNKISPAIFSPMHAISKLAQVLHHVSPHSTRRGWIELRKQLIFLHIRCRTAL